MHMLYHHTGRLQPEDIFPQGMDASSSSMKVQTTFDGTRTDSGLRGEIRNIFPQEMDALRFPTSQNTDLSELKSVLLFPYSPVMYYFRCLLPPESCPDYHRLLLLPEYPYTFPALPYLHKFPIEANTFCTIMDYLGMCLTKRTHPLVHVSNAASFGLYKCVISP